MAIKFEILKLHLLDYFASLKAFEANYIPLFFVPGSVIPGHFAYICPICTTNGLILLEDERIFDTMEFTLDHFPPESVGGRSMLLVCQKCNNEAGTKFESALKLKMENMSFNNQTKTAKVKARSTISTVKGNYPTLLSIRENGEMEISFKPSEKIHSPLLDTWLDHSKADPNWTAEVTIPLADENKVSKALLKAAYLYCFSYWGYAFAYSNTAGQIRNILNGDLSYPLKNPSFWLGEVVKTIPRLQLGLCYIKEPEALKCFVVNMVLTDKESGYHNIASVLIPGPAQTDWQKMVDIQELLDGEPTMNVTFEHVTGYGISDGVLDGYSKSWDHLQSLNKPI